MLQNHKPVSLPDPTEARKRAIEERDRAIALEVVRRGEGRGVKSAVARDMKIEKYQVGRAVKDQGEWARAEHARVVEGKKAD